MVYDSQCGACGYISELNIPSSEVNDKFICEECGEQEMVRIWKTMPGITRASYIDSKKTARAKEVDVHKKVAQLEVEKAGARPENRAEISKEINQLRKISK